MSDDHVTKTIATYDALAKEYSLKNSKYAPVKERDLFLARLPNPATILDAGCGWGRDSEYFCLKGHEVVGIDLSSEFIRMARQNVPKSTFTLMDLRNITFPNESFDGIWACSSLLHLKRNEIPQVLKKFYSLLKTNGIIFILMREGIGEKEDVSKTSRGKVRFFTYVTQNELSNLLEGSGFSAEKMYTWDQKDRWPERSHKIWITSFSRKK